MKGMTTCKVCGRDFPLIIEDHYVARGVEKRGVIAAISMQEEALQYDVFDCPHCGCQNVMQERKILAGFTSADDETLETLHDGCFGCKYAGCAEDEYPCNKCKHCYTDEYEREDEDDE